MISDRAALLERCLRLEARLLGVAVDPPSDDSPVLPLPPRPRVVMRGVTQRRVTPSDVVTMRELRVQGLSYRAISHKVGYSETTAHRYTRDVQVVV